MNSTHNFLGKRQFEKLLMSKSNADVCCQCCVSQSRRSALERLIRLKADSSWQSAIGRRSSRCQRLCCECGVQSDAVCKTDSTFKLTRAPSPPPCPAAEVIIPTWNVSALQRRLSRYLPLFTFLLQPKKQYQTSRPATRA